MRRLAMCAVPSSELLWWELLIDASQCWGNRLQRSFWGSLERMVRPMKNDAMPRRYVQASANANGVGDDGNVAGKISRVSGTAQPAAVQRSRRLCSEAEEVIESMLGFARAITLERSMKTGTDSSIFASSTDLFSKICAKENINCSSFRKWVSWDASLSGPAQLGNGSLAVDLSRKQGGVWPKEVTLLSLLKAERNAQGLERNAILHSLCQDAALHIQNKSAIEVASVLESAFLEICAKYGDSEEANSVLDNIHRQLSGNPQKSRYIGVFVDKVSSSALTSRMEQLGSKSNDNIYLGIFKPYGRIGLVRLGMLLHNHFLSNELKPNVRFWSALADLYVESGVLMDAHNVLKSLENSLAMPFGTSIKGYVLGKHSNYLPQEGERLNDRIKSLENRADKGHCSFKTMPNGGLKHFMMRENLSLSPGCRTVVNEFGPSSSSAMFRRAMSTSTEKQVDEEVGEQQSPSPQQSSSQQQSSLEISDSKPQGGSSWPNPDNAASYVLMSNIYADGDRWDEVKRINEMRLKARAWKKPGKAYVEIKAKVHEFIVGDRTHQDSVNIYEKLRKIKRHMGHIGYVPNVDLILENRSYYDPYKPR